MITVYKTRSGSTYEVCGRLIRRTVRSSISVSERVAEDWREAESISCNGIRHPIVIVWGLGEDEHSSSQDTVRVGVSIGDDDLVVRTTVTTAVIEIERFERVDDADLIKFVKKAEEAS